MGGKRQTSRARSWIAARPHSARKVLTDLDTTPDVAAHAGLTSKIRAYLAEAEALVSSHEFLDIEACRRAAILAERLSGLLPRLTHDYQRIAVLAIRYFLASDDGEDDFSSPAGFDDDLEVLESALAVIEDQGED